MSSKERDKLRNKNYGIYNKHKKNKCEECSIGNGVYDQDGFLVHKKALTVHHIDGNIENNSPENLQTLCRKCHDKKH